MKAKLFSVNKGSKSQLIIALSKKDADCSCDLMGMGSRKIELIGNVEIVGNETDGVTSYQFMSEKYLSDFGSNAGISNEVYEAFCE